MVTADDCRRLLGVAGWVASINLPMAPSAQPASRLELAKRSLHLRRDERTKRIRRGAFDLLTDPARNREHERLANPKTPTPIRVHLFNLAKLTPHEPMFDFEFLRGEVDATREKRIRRERVEVYPPLNWVIPPIIVFLGVSVGLEGLVDDPSE